VKGAPLPVLCCHCTVGVGVPLAAAVNVAIPPAFTVWLDGFRVITGATAVGFTVSVAAVVVAVLTVLVNTAWY
jgi:hypothetical protein